MPIVDLQARLGVNVDKWMLVQSGQQPHRYASRCHAFEKDWIECGHGIGQTRATKECAVEFADLCECLHRTKLISRRQAIIEQRNKLMKEGKYTPPPCHTGKGEEKL